MVAKVGNVTFYTQDPRALAEFWSAVMGYPFDGEYPPEMERALRDAGFDDHDLAARAVAWDGDPNHQRFFFHRYDHERRSRNRLHLDVQTLPDRGMTPEEMDAERDRLLALGATLEKTVDGTWGPYSEYFHMMRDPDGNEFCLH